MLIIVRNEESLSQKTNFILQLSNEYLKVCDVIRIFRRESQKFSEIWSSNEIQLRSSNNSIILSYLLMFFKSPKDFGNGLMIRLFSAKRRNTLNNKGFLSTLSNTLYLRFGTKTQDKNLMNFLRKINNSPKVFIIDEFVSLRCLDIKKLKMLGSLIYVSQDVAYDRFGFRDNFVTKKLMFGLENAVIADFDLVIACSEMERLKYMEMGARKAIYYPNMYPIKEFKSLEKDLTPSLSIVLRERWGPIAEKALEKIFSALEKTNIKLKVYVIGIEPKKVPKNITLEYRKFIPSKLEYLQLLSKSWIGINIGIHMAGTNERKYDYAEAGIVILSDSLGSRGDLLKFEYTFVDEFDLSAKLEQLFELGRTKLCQMGKDNRQFALQLSEKKRAKLLNNFSRIYNR